MKETTKYYWARGTPETQAIYGGLEHWMPIAIETDGWVYILGSEVAWSRSKFEIGEEIVKSDAANRAGQD